MNVSAILTVVHVKSSYFRPEKNNLFVKLPYSKEICFSSSYLIRKKRENAPHRIKSKLTLHNRFVTRLSLEFSEVAQTNLSNLWSRKKLNSLFIWFDLHQQEFINSGSIVKDRLRRNKIKLYQVFFPDYRVLYNDFHITYCHPPLHSFLVFFFFFFLHSYQKVSVSLSILST